MEQGFVRHYYATNKYNPAVSSLKNMAVHF
jgi:hypothetical protein